MELFSVRLVGLNADTGVKLLFTVVLIGLLLGLGYLLRALATWALQARPDKRTEFWARQLIKLGSAVLLIVGLLSIWFKDPTRLTTALGFVTAGLVFALQKATSVAGYFHGPRRHRHQRQDFRRASLELHAQLSVRLGRSWPDRSPTPPTASGPSAFCWRPLADIRSRSVSCVITSWRRCNDLTS